MNLLKNVDRKIILLLRLSNVIGWQCLKYLLIPLVSSKCKIRPKGFKYNIELRTNTSDYDVFLQIFALNGYTFDIDLVPKVIVDCGANIGLTSIYYSNKYPQAKIIAIEPEKSNYETMVKNTCNYPNITCINKGVWKKTCMLEIIDENVSNWEFMVRESNSKTGISALSIPDLIKEFKISQIDILKMDIEGSEKEVFEENIVSWIPFVKVLIIELHDRYKYGCSQALFKSLVPYQYDVQMKGDNLCIYFHHIK